ncbi:MAG: AAA family ATPase [Deltaproteobacteria bacterium]|nr:AAA family ATPase [Deltaproteobacteria bacterium]MBI3386284.1 AAA family ATPase [Deltaproteobacteria bacterium]
MSSLRGEKPKPPHDSNETIVFPPFALDLRGGRLLRGAHTIPLRPKTWAVLCYLAERPGVLVSKEELFAQIWAGTAVGDDSLTKSIHEIRDALADDLKAPRFVATVPRRGFRFVAQTSSQRRTAVGHVDQQLVTNFIGRTSELSRLGDCFRRACSGQRQLAFVTGEPGIGKTALVEAFISALGVQPSELLIGQGCSVEQTGTREAYLPVLGAVERLMHDSDVEGFVPLLRRFAPTWLAQVPWLIEASDAKRLADSLVDTRPERMLREFCAFIEALTEGQTLLLVLEDLHWSDPATIELLTMLAQRREPARLLVIGTYRPADVATREHPLVQAKQTLQQRRRCIEIPLQDLTATNVETYVEKRLPGYDRPRELARLIHEHTEGNPLFMIAVLGDLIARGWLVDTAPGWALTVPIAKADLGVPDDLRQMIAIQLHAMSPADQSLLEVASVAGTDFAAPALAAVLNVGLDEVETACERLSRLHRFLRVVGIVEWPPDGTARRYGFIHALYRHVVYEAIPEGRRQRLHQRIGETIESAYDSRVSDIAAELAVHFERSRDRPRAIKYLTATATRAQRRFATREAIGALESALTLATSLPNTEARQRQELDLRMLLGPALGNICGFASEQVRQNYERARALCNAVGTPTDLYGVLYALWHSQSFRAEVAAEVTARELAQLAGTSGKAELRLQADALLGRTALYQGKFVESRDRLAHVIEAWRNRKGGLDESVFAIEPLIATNGHYAFALWFLGYPDRANHHIKESLALVEHGARPLTRAAGLFHAAYVHHLCQNSREAQDVAEQAISLSTEHGLTFTRAQVTALSGWALAQQGEGKRAINMIQQGLDEYRSTGAKLLSSHMLAWLADAHRRLGEIKAGLAAVDEGIVIAEESLDSAYLAELWRIKGALLLASVDGPRSTGARGKQARVEQAEGCLQRALEIARAGHARSLELRAAINLAQLWRNQRKPAAARALLGDIYSWFTEGFHTPDLREANALLEETLS